MTTRTLVIEDQQDNRRILRDLLRSASHEMIEAVQSTMRPLVAQQAIAFRIESDIASTIPHGCNTGQSKSF